jgi:hypothetical protein
MVLAHELVSFDPAQAEGSAAVETKVAGHCDRTVSNAPNDELLVQQSNGNGATFDVRGIRDREPMAG